MTFLKKYGKIIIICDNENTDISGKEHKRMRRKKHPIQILHKSFVLLILLVFVLSYETVYSDTVFSSSVNSSNFTAGFSKLSDHAGNYNCTALFLINNNSLSNKYFFSIIILLLAAIFASSVLIYVLLRKKSDRKYSENLQQKVEEAEKIIEKLNSDLKSNQKIFEAIFDSFETDYIMNLNTDEVRSNFSEIRVHEELNKIIFEQAKQLKEDYLYMLDALNAAVELRDNESAAHEKRIKINTELILKELNKSYPVYNLADEEIEIVSIASVMHDVGKIAIPDAILLKPGRLTPEEFDVMKQHTVKGCEMLDKIQFMRKNENFEYYYNICRWHHEKYDGMGYPDGLKGNEIPIYVQAVAVADCFDALTSDRPYKKAYPLKTAKKMIIEGECGKFNPDIIECFRKVNLKAF